jgi:hypothetical protein
MVFGLSPAAAILGGAGIQGATSLAGGKKGASAASQAASQQAAVAEQALQLQQSMFQTNQNNLQPFINVGLNATAAVQPYANQILNQPAFTWDPSKVAQTPGYQFTQNQIRAQLANNASVTGPGGAANWQLIQGAGNVASTTYNQQFQNFLAQSDLTMQQQNQQLQAAAYPITNIGLPAAGALAGVSLASAAGQSNALSNIGAAQAAGTVGSANALTAGLSGAGSAAGGGLSNIGQLAFLQGLGGNASQAANIGSEAGVNVDVSGGGDVPGATFA